MNRDEGRIDRLGRAVRERLDPLTEVAVQMADDPRVQGEGASG